MRTVWKRILLMPIALLAAGFMAAMLFLAAGRWDLPFFWAYVLTYALLVVIGFLVVDPSLYLERGRDIRGKWNTLVTTARFAMTGHLIVAGLDVGRYHWSDRFLPALQVVGLAGFAAGIMIITWAMAVNRYFLPTVRIQTERGHQVVTTGPYRLVRHPGYAGVTICVLCSSVALGSWISTLPILVLLAGLLWRVRAEDRLLREHLEGYADYARRVRFRLLPGVW